MRYLLKQKFWSWGDDFRIQDAEGRDVFFVDGRAFSWGDKLLVLILASAVVIDMVRQQESKKD